MMNWLDDIVKRIEASNNWTCRDWIGASKTIGRVSNAGADDTVSDLVGCLIDEIERLRALLEGYEAMEKTMKRKVSG